MRTGQLDIVPGVELPTSPAPGLGFSRDSQWLVIALNDGPMVRLLTWRPGLAKAEQTTPVATAANGAPALAVLPGQN